MEPIHQDNNTRMTDLNELCMETIFKFLPLRELAAMSLTCKIYKKEAERYFTLHHEVHCPPIQIKSTNEEIDFAFRPNAEFVYEKVFEHLIRSVDLSFHGNLTNEDCEFVQEFCAEQLRSLTFNFVSGRGDKIIDGSAIEIMEDQLKGLKELKIVNFVVSDLYNDLMRFCESLESLTIEINRGGHDDFYGVYGKSWLKQKHPNLKTLRLCVPKYLNIHLDSFLALNPNVNNFICNNFRVIQDVCISEYKIHRVAFAFCHEHDFTWLMYAMEKWSKQKRFEEFELILSIHEFRGDVLLYMSTTIQNITSLHLGINIDYFIDSAINVSMQSVKTLCVKMPSVNYVDQTPLDVQSVYDQLNRYFPNLGQLKTMVKDDDEFTLDIVSRFKKSRKFDFINGECDLCTLTKYTDLKN